MEYKRKWNIKKIIWQQKSKNSYWFTFFTPQTSCYIVVERGIIDVWHLIKSKKWKVKF